MVSHRVTRPEMTRSTATGGLLRSQRGAEVVQLAVMIPIVLGVLLTVFNAFQLVSLRSKMRSTASQMAQYISAYAVPPQQIESNDQPDLCTGLWQLVATNLGEEKTNTAEFIVPLVNLYVINDPTNPEFVNNRTPVDCRTLADRLQPNQQFAVEIVAQVNWLWLGYSRDVSWRWVQDVFSLTLTERAFGVAPGEPFFVLRDPQFAVSPGGAGGCRVDISWVLDSSFQPEVYEVYRSDVGMDIVADTIESDATSYETSIPSGRSTTILIKAVCGAREEEIRESLGCNVPEPTPTP